MKLTTDDSMKMWELFNIARRNIPLDYNGIIMSSMASQITSLTVICSTVYSGAVQRKYQSPVSLAFVRGIHRWPVNSPHRGPVTRKMFPFDDVIIDGGYAMGSFDYCDVHFCNMPLVQSQITDNSNRFSLNLSCIIISLKRNHARQLSIYKRLCKTAYVQVY